MEASQLKHAGFKVEKNSWYDISLLARMCLNHQIGEYKEGGGKFDLGSLSLNLLKDFGKQHLVEELMEEYKIRKNLKKSNIYAVKGIIHNPKFKEYALPDTYLTQKLHEYFLTHSNYKIWEEDISPIHYLQWKNGFKGIEIDIKAVNQRIIQMQQLRDKIVDKLPNITTPSSKSGNKGWNSSKLISKYLSEQFPIQELDKLNIKTPSNIYSFDKTSRLKLLQKYPNNQIIKLVNDLHKKEHIIEELTTIRDKSRNTPIWLYDLWNRNR